MGKKYYCDYCDKTIMNTLSTIKTHNKGMVHQKLLLEHYQQFKSPEEILAQESKKKPCVKHPLGKCKYGLICRYTHYSTEEINSMRAYVSFKKDIESKNAQPSFQDIYQRLQIQKSIEDEPQKDTTIIDDNGVTHVLPWTYNVLLDTFVDLPPSIKRMKVEDLKDVQFGEWGSESL
ncbi:zinc finger matrin-type protein 5 isoform X2 [Manduca sexta]|uniref:zinc finger matrin-type protein 5 isoform X2 n=1 Tax=Manduca sexta TaxID=7130 RepID=UPI001183166D|nr:zinc finger matrin-type protein 5 isoform X2 [Manduca sexta]